MPKKYHYTLEPTWVARKRGSRTGYGKTPAAALRYIEDGNRARNNAVVHERNAVRAERERWDAAINKANADVARVNTESRARHAESVRLREEAAQLKEKSTSADYLVLMAMAYFKTTDPHDALDKAEAARKAAGTTALIEGGEAAAVRVALEWPKWKAAFDKAVESMPDKRVIKLVPY